jgi:hypothetical protein
VYKHKKKKKKKKKGQERKTRAVYSCCYSEEILLCLNAQILMQSSIFLFPFRDPLCILFIFYFIVVVIYRWLRKYRCVCVTMTKLKDKKWTKLAIFHWNVCVLQLPSESNDLPLCEIHKCIYFPYFGNFPFHRTQNIYQNTQSPMCCVRKLGIFPPKGD